MPDKDGKLTAADIPIINDFMRRVSPDSCITCPVTGVRIPMSQWHISDRLCMLPTSGQDLQPSLSATAPVLSCRSPAGGVVYLDAIFMGLINRATKH